MGCLGPFLGRCVAYMKNKVKWVHRSKQTTGPRNINLCDSRAVGAEEEELWKNRCLRGEARRRYL